MFSVHERIEYSIRVELGYICSILTKTLSRCLLLVDIPTYYTACYFL